MRARIGPEHRAMARGWVLSLLACLASADAAAAQSAAADLVIRNARIYTVDAAQPWASSIAIRGKHIVAVGGDRQTRALTGRRTRVIDLGGRLVLPAFHDAHAHPLAGGLTHSQCPLYSGNSVADYRRLIAACLAEQPGDGWVYGVGWRDGMFPPEGVPTKDLLDEIAPDRPVAFGSTGEHSLWVNSRALQLAGITRDTPDPPNGRIDRDARGEPVGALQEAAMSLVFDLLPPPSQKAREGALRYGLDYYHRMGIVGWHDASVPVSATDPLQTIETYAALHGQGQLKAHIVLALTWDNARGLEQLGDIQSAAERASTLALTARTVKFFIDGVLAQRSAALLEPYADQAGFRGDLQIEEAVFQEAITQLDARGFQVHVHAIGDRAVRASLNAFSSAQQRNGKKDNRHLLAHVNLVADDDLARFAALRVVTVFQPLWARLDDYMRMTGVRVGPERLERMYPAASLLHAGATVAYGSDWPVASANPLEGIEVALTRRQLGASDGERLAANQRLSLEQAIRGYTINSAYASHKDDVSGSIENGKSADIVVLDRDLFHIPVHEIGRAQVLLTMLAGEIVHDELGAELACSSAQAQMRSQTSSSAAPSTVIRDVVLVDGTGEHRRHGAVRITGDKITAVGQLQARPGEVIVEGGGLVLAPGFIDSHSHHDTNFFDQRDVVAATSQGVTTIVVGQDGFSQVPLSAFFARIEATPVAVNVAAYSGHNTLRAAVMNETEKQLPASKAQLRRMSQLLQEDMDAGALGLSTGLGYESGIHADFGEIANLAATAARNGGRYISHIRNENQRLSESIEEAIDIGRYTRAPVQISHIKIGSRNSWGQAASILNRLDEARRAGIQITADVYPYTYWQTTMRILFNGGSLDDRERIASVFAQIIPPSMLYILRYEPDKSVEGKTVETLARERGEDPVSLYIDLAKRAAAYESANTSASRPVESIIGTAMSEVDIETFLRWGHSNICSDGMDGGHPRGYGAFARVLGRYVRERGVLTLEQAIARMTRSTAQHIGLEQRGVIAVGAHADLVLLDPSTVADRASIDSPTQRAVGIHRVWVNGTLVYQHGTATGSYPGAVIRRKS